MDLKFFKSPEDVQADEQEVKIQSQQQVQIDNDKLLELIKNQELLKNEVEKIFLQYPRAGLYKNEKASDFDIFYADLLNTFYKKEGERGEVITQIHQEMFNIKDELNILLKDINCTYQKNSIRTITKKLQSYIPSKTYKSFNLTTETIIKKKETLVLFNDTSSSLYNSIFLGLKTKNGEQKALEKMKELGEKKIEELQILEQQRDELEQLLQTDIKYQNFLKLSQLVQPFSDQWNKIDKEMGKISTENGRDFQLICVTYGVGVVLDKLKLKKQEIELITNVGWEGVDGQVDIIIADKKQLKKVYAIVECKARCFDVQSGYLQSGPLRSDLQKSVKVEGTNLLEIPRNVPCFVITTIPPNEFQIGAESQLKEDINQILINLEMDELLSAKEVYEKLADQYIDSLSPLEWFRQMRDIIIVLNI